MRILESLIFSTLYEGQMAQLENFDREVRMCAQSTAYVGPDNFQYDLKNLFHTAETCPDETTMKLNYGTVPSWIDGHWFRTGPGKFEFGSDPYLNMADPQALWQRMSFSNGQVSYKSDFQYSTHHVKNEEAGYIMYPEMGTWGNPEYANVENDPTSEKLAQWISTDPDFASDNAYVSFFTIGGGLYASGETYFIWKIDPTTLKGVRKINLMKLFPETLFKNNLRTRCSSVATHLAHYHYDVETDEFIGAFTCMTDNPVAPKIKYVVYKIPNAGTTLQAVPESPEAIWSRGVILGEVEGKHNAPAHMDYKQEYFHDFAVTKNHIIFGTTNIQIDYMEMPRLMITRTPMAFGAQFNPDDDGTWYIFNRHVNKAPQEFKSDPFFSTHVINAFEDIETNTLVLDTTHADNANQFGAVWMANLTGDHDMLKTLFHHVAPVQVPVRFVFDLSDNENKNRLTPQKLYQNGHLPGGGADYPVINYVKDSQKNYDHVWMNGFREVFNVDSIYRLDLSTGASICRFMDGYVPTETRYIARTSSSAEEDDVLVTVWSPLLSTQPPLLHILNPTTLGLIAELEIPVSFLPVGVHGMFYQFEK